MASKREIEREQFQRQQDEATVRMLYLRGRGVPVAKIAAQPRCTGPTVLKRTQEVRDADLAHAVPQESEYLVMSAYQWRAKWG